MDDAQLKALVIRTIDELQQATGIAGGHHGCAGGFNMLKLALQELVGHFGLDDIVNSGTAAAPRAFRKLDEL